MRTILISVFGDELKPDGGARDLETGYVMVQVAEERPWGRREYYDFRLRAPAQEHELDEVRQLLEDLVYSAVAHVGGLQPALF